MIISLPIIIYTVFTAFISGLVLYKCLTALFKTEAYPFHSSFIAFGGLCWIAFVLQVQHVFLPIDGLSHVLIWLINGSVWIRHGSFFKAWLLQFKNDFFSSRSSVFLLVLILL